MTKAQMRVALNQYIKIGKVGGYGSLPAASDLYDEYLNHALDLVTLELAKYLPQSFLVTENISLVADQNNYTLTASWLQIWDMQKNVSSDNPTQIKYLDVHERGRKEYVGQTEAEPEYYYTLGDTIYFVPTPSTTTANYAKAFLVVKEASALPTAGPTYIPAAAHRLIPIKAAILMGIANGIKTVGQLEAMYKQLLEAAVRILAFRIQGQPRFLVGAEEDFGSTREPTSYDRSGFFD